MQFTPKKSLKKFQQGGPVVPEEPMMTEEMPAGEMPTEEVATEETQQENPLIVLAQAAIQGLQNQDCQMMAQVCQGLIQLVQQLMQPAPQEETGEPVFKKGGVLLRRIKK